MEVLRGDLNHLDVVAGYDFPKYIQSTALA